MTVNGVALNMDDFSDILQRIGAARSSIALWSASKVRGKCISDDRDWCGCDLRRRTGRLAAIAVWFRRLSAVPCVVAAHAPVVQQNRSGASSKLCRGSSCPGIHFSIYYSVRRTSSGGEKVGPNTSGKLRLVASSAFRTSHCGEYISPAPTVSAAPATVMEYIAPAPTVSCGASAPVVDVSPAPAVYA